MNLLTNSVKAVFDFVVGDMRVLIGTLFALLITAGLVPFVPVAAGGLLVVLLALTLIVALHRELRP